VAAPVGPWPRQSPLPVTWRLQIREVVAVEEDVCAVPPWLSPESGPATWNPTWARSCWSWRPHLTRGRRERRATSCGRGASAP